MKVRDLPERGETARQALRAALSGEPRTAHELSADVGVPERDVAEHLEHLERALRHEGSRLVVEPATCSDCGFVFRKRERLGRPSRCPVCRSEHVAAPRFSIRAAGS